MKEYELKRENFSSSGNFGFASMSTSIWESNTILPREFTVWISTSFLPERESASPRESPDVPESVLDRESPRTTPTLVPEEILRHPAEDKFRRLFSFLN